MKLAAITVTYFPNKEEFIKNTESYINFVDTLYIWDNTPIEKRKAEKDGITLIKEKYPDKVFVFVNDKNMGLAYAYNRGGEKAKVAGFTHIMTMDQDSSFQEFEGFIQSIENVINTDEAKNIGVYMPLRNQPQVYTDWEPWEQASLVQSGSIFPLSVFDKVGLFNEEYFIDGIDLEMGFRLRKFGYKLTVYPGCNMIHQIGSGENVSFCGIKFTNRNYAPMRLFYQVRNHRFMAKAYPDEECISRWLGWKLILKPLIKIIFGEKNKIAKIGAIFRGIFHGLFNIKSGF